MLVQLSRFALATVSIASAVIISLSPLNIKYAFPSWGSVALGTALGLILYLLLQQGLRLKFKFQPSSSVFISFTYKISYFGLGLAFLSQTASATTQALTAVALPSPHLVLHSTPGMGIIYCLLAGFTAFVGVQLSLRQGRKGLLWTALLGAGFFSSTLYLRSFAVHEAGPVYGSIFGLALIAACVMLDSNSPSTHSRSSNTHRLWYWALVFLVAYGLSVFFSPVPGQSIDAWSRLVVLIGLAFILSTAIRYWPLYEYIKCNDRSSLRVLKPVYKDRLDTWKKVSWVVVLIAGVLPIILTLGKLNGMIFSFDLLSALAYRLHPSEMGGANLIARSVLIVTPLGLALLFTSKNHHRISRPLVTALLIGSAFVMLYSRSWEGFFAWLVSLSTYGLLVYWNVIRETWHRLYQPGWIRWVLAGILVFLILMIGIASVFLASELNIHSFNGRLMYWNGAILAWVEHPWVGGGAANEAIYTPYAENFRLMVENQVMRDDIDYKLHVNTGSTLKLHSHNLLLEIGAGTGLLGFIPFLGFLVVLIWSGLRTWGSSNGLLHQGVAACLAGITGALAWGILDVLWVTPPFFSFPVWGLIGLLIGAGLISNEEQRGSTGDDSLTVKSRTIISLNWRSIIGKWSLVFLSILCVLLPALTYKHYSSGFLAFQEHRYANAANNFKQATVFDPLNPKLFELLAKSRLEIGDIEGARFSYERASALKQGYSPYLAQLGWLAWFQGDLDKAGQYFQQSIEQDPKESWDDGLYANLGLLEAARGNYPEAFKLFKKSIELKPHTAAESYWSPVLQRATDSLHDESMGEEKEFDIPLDPVYMRGPSPELDKRILEHLGVSGITVRNFKYEQQSDSPISLNKVLDAIGFDYKQVHTINNSEAQLLLASLAEASRQAGLTDRAEHAYLEFQAFQPKSAYGFRDLGTLYRQQGQFDDAQIMLEHAVKISPNDVESRYGLTLIYLDQEKWDKADNELDRINSQSMITLFHSRLFDPDIILTQARQHVVQGQENLALEDLLKVISIRGEPKDYLRTANLSSRQGDNKQATDLCLQAAKALFRNWSRPYSPELQEVGLCLSKSPDIKTMISSASKIARQYPFLGQILLGHTYYSLGQFDKALDAYENASKIRPDEGAPHYFSGEVYQALDQPIQAMNEYLKATQINPNESLPLFAIGKMQWSLGDREAGINTIRKVLEVTPGWDEVHIILGNMLLENGDLDGATYHFQQAQYLEGDINENIEYDFSTNLADADIQTQSPDYVKNDYFAIDGLRKRVVFEHPDSRLGYTIDLKNDAQLAFDIGTSPESWTKEGDGVSFAVYILSEQGTDQIFSTYIDPKNKPADQRWHQHTIDLSPYTGQTVTLIFETGAGPAGDYRYDWAGWGEPRLLRP